MSLSSVPPSHRQHGESNPAQVGTGAALRGQNAQPIRQRRQTVPETPLSRLAKLLNPDSPEQR